MTEADARQRCEELNRETGHDGPLWTVREVEPGDWRPARAKLAGLPPREPYKATTEAKPKPPEPEDPRDSLSRNIPGYNG